MLSQKKKLAIQQLIIEILNKHVAGLAVDQLYIQINMVKSCSLASIYRILSEMRKLGIVRKTEFARQKAIYTMAQQQLNCSVMDVSTSEISPCIDQDILLDFKQLLDKYQNEFTNMDVVLYKK